MDDSLLVRVRQRPGCMEAEDGDGPDEVPGSRSWEVPAARRVRVGGRREPGARLALLRGSRLSGIIALLCPIEDQGSGPCVRIHGGDRPGLFLDALRAIETLNAPQVA